PVRTILGSGIGRSCRLARPGCERSTNAGRPCCRDGVRLLTSLFWLGVTQCQTEADDVADVLGPWLIEMLWSFIAHRAQIEQRAHWRASPVWSNLGTDCRANSGPFRLCPPGSSSADEHILSLGTHQHLILGDHGELRPVLTYDLGIGNS